MRPRRTLALGAVGLAALLVPPVTPTRPLLVWNATASVPVGLYRVTPPDALRVGDLVLALPPPDLAALFADRGYLPRGVPLLKPVAAVAGASVCRAGARVSIDGQPVAEALSADRFGRPLPAWSGCRVLGPDRLFLLNPAVPASLDGRVFGPVLLSSIIGKAVPLWIP
jgi:conjugative transfer signal peptidase TraF